MKRIISILTVVLLSTAMMMADEIVRLGDFYYSLGATTATLVKDQSSDQSVYKEYINVTIPASVTYSNYTYPVKTIGTSAFEGCSNLQSVTLPSSITAIYTDAFYGCRKLGSVNLEEGLTNINQRAFYNCNLTSITIPSTVTSMGNKAFYGNPLVSVVWKPVECSVGTGEDAPFYSAGSTITSFKFGEQVEKVPPYICRNLSKIDTIVLPPSVYSLGTYSFAYCTSLKSINLPVTQKTLPVSFLEGCSSLETIELPATLTTISTDVFYGCSSLKEINLHEGITTINQRAFYNCKLSTITIPSTVTSIGNIAFQGNPLTSVIWKPANCSIGTGDNAPFYSTSSQIKTFLFGDSVKTIPGYLCNNMKKLENITLPEKLTTINQNAFYGCSLLKDVTIPATVTSIGTYAFAFCTSIKNFAFPDGIKTIATSVLEGNTALMSVKIPESVTTINGDAFYGCSALQALYNYAYTPQTITERTIYNVNKNTCVLYVPKDAADSYASKLVWCDFKNVVRMNTGLRFEDNYVNLSYLDQEGEEMYGGVELLHMPIAPKIDGFTFEKWVVKAGDFADGIKLQAVYKADTATGAPAQYVNPANPAQKLIRQGNVYILQDGKTYTVDGKQVR